MPFHFYNPIALIWLWLVPAVAGLFAYAAVRRRQAARAFGAGTASISRKREALGVCTAVALTVFALARPAWDMQESPLQEAGRDVVFLLDVSRSMLAKDRHPNRLENAKIAILDCVEHLSGDRVGLVLFAGSAEIRCPLTSDYGYFRMALRQADPESVTCGGTRLANAIEKVADRLIDPKKAGLQDLILISDGEDMVEGADEIKAVELLGDAGVRLIAIGLGNQKRGRRIMLVDEAAGTHSFLMHDNMEVWTRLRSETLRRMAAAVPNSFYFDVGCGRFDLAQIYRQIMENAERISFGSQASEHYQEKFPLFIAGAVAILLASSWRRTP